MDHKGFAGEPPFFQAYPAVNHKVSASDLQSDPDPIVEKEKKSGSNSRKIRLDGTL